ncbi:hypothetical protein T4D_13989 [Trichinella pseudospiralis]|uniref:Uncharacterized protein n=1 Tax=Trichinella pseudospiralis TaxID=6337 RepID=A0A0V1FMM0_TRIPS|nr:hypothetical protein T4D_13989 [Trichinella pseudospiralis]
MLEKLASNCKVEKPERASSPVAVADRSISVHRYNCYRSGRGQWSIHHYWSATVSYCCATVERWQQSIDHRVVHATGRPSQESDDDDAVECQTEDQVIHQRLISEANIFKL